MKKLATRAVRVALTIAILVGLVLFARKVNWTRRGTVSPRRTERFSFSRRS
jgi:hypothetical protein